MRTITNGYHPPRRVVDATAGPPPTPDRTTPLSSLREAELLREIAEFREKVREREQQLSHLIKGARG